MGGEGYIGSHAAVVLAARRHQVVCIDNLCNRGGEVLARRATITGQRPILRVVGDARDTAALQQDIGQHGIQAVIQFAGLKAVGEAVAKPVTYVDVAACYASAMRARAEMEREDTGGPDDMVASSWFSGKMLAESEGA